MEAIEELPVQDNPAETIKINVSSADVIPEAEPIVPSDVCHKSNGIGDSNNSEQVEHPSDDTHANTLEVVQAPETFVEEEICNTEIVADQEIVLQETTEDLVNNAAVSDKISEKLLVPDTIPDEIIKTDVEECHTEEVEVDGIVETAENVRFETEILIETNVDESNRYRIIYSENDDPDHTNMIMSELGQNIELSEALRSSDISENVENNNCEVSQEVFNKEELLDILEGNDAEESKETDNFASECKKLESQLALQQLTRLKQTRKPRNSPRKLDKRSSSKSESPKEGVKRRSSTQRAVNKKLDDSKKIDEVKKGLVEIEVDVGNNVNDTKKDEGKATNEGKNVNDDEHDDGTAVVDDDEGDENMQVDDNVTVDVSKNEVEGEKAGGKKVNNSQTNSEASLSKEDSIVHALFKDWDDDPEETVTADTTVNNSDSSKGDAEKPRRLGRVIKKKVIFDPDNPETYTKSKVIVKKENQAEKDIKEQPTPKKIKTDSATPRSKSKSPIQAKLQWKKPQAKNLKQNKRLTEIDRLLMDEGAVNMICQLTPEAPKGHKNMKSKAEFIKKIQRSTPEGNEMKFRERKKEIKFEESDVKRVGTGKDRLSLSGSVKSPSVSEDFEAHSADDSIIYRRHSSSSYSSPCMSPRRLSDVESINQGVLAMSQAAAAEKQSRFQQQNNAAVGTDVFMSEGSTTLAKGVINKTNFLSIKEKLNSKLSQALNKRKRDTVKVEKPPKIKRVSKSSEKSNSSGDHKYVRLTFDQNLAEICVLVAGSTFNVEVINELKTALDVVESNNDISVTLLTAELTTLCSGLELKPLLDEAQGSAYAQALAESVRSLVCTLECHSKLVCTVVEDRCSGLGLSLVALSDVAVASETSHFQLANNALLQPGTAVLNACSLPQSLVKEMVVFDRPVLAAAAQQAGLVARTVWPERVQEQARVIAKDLAAQPTENILMKKQLLRLKRRGNSSFQAEVETERDLFIKYWTSATCRDLVRASHEPAKE